MEKYAVHRVYGGTLYRCRHTSSTLGGLIANFSVFMPSEAAEGGKKVPMIYFLCGLTASDENFVLKCAHAFKKLNELGIGIAIPDTSPRGANIEGEEDVFYFGTAAGYYLNATQEPWSKYYKMDDYCTKELIELVETNFPVEKANRSIMGHSMGGHGALILGLKHHELYKCVSAFAPVAAPSSMLWGHYAFSRYLGDDETSWKDHDTVELLKKYKGPDLHLKIDLGSEDGFFTPVNLLQSDSIPAACKAAGLTVDFNLREGYDHSFFFVQTFIDEHLEHHAKYLKA